MSSDTFGWESLLDTDAPPGCSLQTALCFDPGGRRDKQSLIERVLSRGIIGLLESGSRLFHVRIGAQNFVGGRFEVVDAEHARKTGLAFLDFFVPNTQIENRHRVLQGFTDRRDFQTVQIVFSIHRNQHAQQVQTGFE